MSYRGRISAARRFVLLTAVLSTGLFESVSTQSGLCSSPIQNPVACENTKPGNPRSEWDINGIGDPNIQGFASEFSVNKGAVVDFKIKTPSSNYVLDIYRLGYYGGHGARKITTINPSSPLPQVQPNCLSDSTTGLVDCGNWARSASWAVPSSAVSGVYIARLVRRDGSGGASHIVFVVRDDSGQSDLLFQTSDTTWQAYNTYGGNSLYVGAPVGRAYKVSYNRPMTTRTDSVWSWLFNAEYPMIRFLEANGYNVSYFSGIDSDRRGSEILEHKVFLSVGHDEYWSATQRANVEAARGAGVNLAFFSGNEVFWKTRWEASIDGSGSPYKTLVSYKETHAGAKIDPTTAWTGTWRDPRFSPPADGGRPENALTGTIFRMNGTRIDSITVPAAFKTMRLWRNTDIALLQAGQVATFPLGTLGYEWDEAPENAFTPPGLLRLSSTTVVDASPYLLDYGSTYGSGTATHSLTLYRHGSGALVFGAGTVQWSYGLDSTHDGVAAATDVRMQQATINLLADMGAQPSTPMSGLVAASASSDTIRPASTINSPIDGATYQVGDNIAIRGTALDSGGGFVAGVEVSTDGGATWRRANGTGNWSLNWTPQSSGNFALRSRAIDDSGNLEIAHGVSIAVLKGSGISLWNGSAVPAIASNEDAQAIQVGVKFTADVAGFVRGIRFYKGLLNTGTHTVSLWTSGGTLLAQAVPGSELPSGWQQVNFASPVPVSANTIYVASYHTTSGYYSVTRPYFTAQYDSGPLHALADGASGGNGVYSYRSTPGFPVSPFAATNYWVDVEFMSGSSDTAAPVISSVQATSIGSSTATISWTTNEASDTQVEYGATAGYGSLTAVNTSMATGHSQTLSGLTSSTTYHYRVRSRDAAGNLALSSDFTFTTCPCGGGGPVSGVSLWNGGTLPAVQSHQDSQAISVGVKFRADVSGTIQAIRFYKGAQNTGVHTVSLWTSGGTLLAQTQSVNETASGWQQVNLPAPVQISANTVYVASYHTTSGYYAVTRPYFTASFDNGPLHALADGAAGGNGVYGYGATPAFPTNTYELTNYWVDVVFSSGSSDTTAPVISSVQATSIGNSTATISWTTNEASDTQVEYGSTGGYGSLTAVNTSMATGHSQTLSGLTSSTTYHYRVRSRDAAGNLALSSDFTFTTCPCGGGGPVSGVSLWNASTLPAAPSHQDSQAISVGVKFRADASGTIQAIRFYKGSQNTGVHTVSLWTSGGTLLAQTQSVNETASGWQQVNLPAPVQISANTVYVASYHTTSGYYAVTRPYFTASFDNGPLHALADGAAGGNGVYGYGATPAFPTNTYELTNYWVDVIFSTSP